MLFNSLSTQFKVMISPQFPFLTVLMIIRAVMEITCYVTKVWGFLLLLCGCSTWIVQYIENSSKEISQGERKHGFLEACSFSAILNGCYPGFFVLLAEWEMCPKTTACSCCSWALTACFLPLAVCVLLEMLLSCPCMKATTEIMLSCLILTWLIWWQTHLTLVFISGVAHVLCESN